MSLTAPANVPMMKGGHAACVLAVCALAAVIRKLANDPALRAAMGARARQTMIDRWGMQHALAEWRAMLEEIGPSSERPTHGGTSSESTPH